jgi:hypothetical protein
MRKLFAAIAVLALFVSGSTVEAAFKVRVTSANFGSVTIADAFPLPSLTDASALEGRIRFEVVFGGITTITGNSANSKPLVGSAAVPIMTVNWEVLQTAGAADTITIEVTDTNFQPAPVGGLSATIGGTLDNPPVSSVTYQVFTDHSGAEGAEFGTGGTSSALLAFNSSPFGGSTTLGVGGSPYSITQRIIVNTAAGSGEASGNATVTAIPVPGGVVLVLTALPAFGFGAWMRRRKPVTV